MRSMSAPSESEATVWHYDGVTGVRRAPCMVVRGEGFVLVEDGQASETYAFADLMPLGNPGGFLQFGLKRRPGWRIGFLETPPAGIAAHLPRTRGYGALIDRIGLWPAVLGFAAVSVAVVFAVLSAPTVIARMIPRSAEARMGDLMVGDFGDRACATPRGSAALAALTRRMNVARDVDVRVIDVPMVNAITLPGGHVVLFSGLIQRAGSPDEVAGVLAHELGHVEHRDVLESLVRQFGLSVVLGGLDGKVGGYTNALLSASYSRSAESRADGYAIDALGKANVSPRATADLFKRLAKAELNVEGAATLMSYLASHPMSADREARFAASAKGRAYTPALDPQQWQALRDICTGKPRGWESRLPL
jgi:Zn-dependent protease with chaperone function